MRRKPTAVMLVTHAQVVARGAAREHANSVVLAVAEAAKEHVDHLLDVKPHDSNQRRICQLAIWSSTNYNIYSYQRLSISM